MVAWTADIVTIFPDMFPGPLAQSLAGKALEEKLWHLETTDIREFATDKHQTVDDTPCGGGPGMVMRADVIDAALASIEDLDNRPLIYLTPRGRPFDQHLARELAAGPGIVALCGRYEGVDERVLESRKPLEISLGDFVLSGGEPAAIALLDACVRLIPGVVGDQDSLTDESFESGLLEYPQYTRPQVWRGRAVPEVLLSGHHKKIRAWRHEESERITRERRPDLWSAYVAQQEKRRQVQ
ncbi:MAG TPA: tRNA (guanosine(37)-N1)-methyltransferase TrmD [Rhodospirillaceae bacterium]|nr:tRNA (guanosine(37)-N1)-methyltransferase TrmD [Rhodospirillaceae bacterium]HAA92597.1 tRNA (guanosine(37)-N1)-methyltransferase TrmD [Rhodospirillaceae bacterium]HAT35197.1 tRNA (guanosine(37)-N1)-methyltransferase TrmD [Rhodospirillaceae bacterium]